VSLVTGLQSIELDRYVALHLQKQEHTRLVSGD